MDTIEDLLAGRAAPPVQAAAELEQLAVGRLSGQVGTGHGEQLPGHGRGGHGLVAPPGGEVEQWPVGEGRGKKLHAERQPVVA